LDATANALAADASLAVVAITASSSSTAAWARGLGARSETSGHARRGSTTMDAARLTARSGTPPRTVSSVRTPTDGDLYGRVASG